MAWLKLEKQNEIDSQISNLLNQYDLSVPENNILEIINTIGIKVYEADLSSYGRNVSGVIRYPQDNEVPSIIIEKNMSRSRKVFTLAHELGHYILHPSEEKYRVDSFNYSGNNQDTLEETEANYFAASLLVPKGELLSLMKKGIKSREKLARYFGVSQAVVSNRIEWIRANGG